MIEPLVPQLVTCPACAGVVNGTPDPVSGTVTCGACGTRFDPRQDATAASSGPDVELPWQPQAGDEVGPYTLVAALGRGGMASVFKARQASLARPVAVKILHAHLAADPDLRRRFDREAEALVQVAHPRIVPVIDRGEHRGRPYLVTALCGERTLRDEIERGPLAPHRVAKLAAEVLDGLAHAHHRGLVHRDIKPENLILGDDGAAYIADFGIAQVGRSLEGHTLTQLTQTNVVLGTVAYMAPEQGAGAKRVDHRCDLYALGVVCYEALTGHLPQGRFEDPSEHLQDLPPEQRRAWDGFLLALLERDPDRRPDSAATARAALAILYPVTAEHEARASGAGDGGDGGDGGDDGEAEATGAEDGRGTEARRLYSFGPVSVELPTDLPPEVADALQQAEGMSGEALSTARQAVRRARSEVEEAMRGTSTGAGVAAAAMDLACRAVGEPVEPPLPPRPAAPPPPKHGRKLMRARDNQWIAGVCGGLGAWLGIGPGWLRLGLAVGPALTGGALYLPLIVAYLVTALVMPQCPDPRYRPRPLNAGLPARPDGWVLGVCALLAERTALPAWAWRLITAFTVPLGSWIPYLLLGILLPSRARRPRPAVPRNRSASEPVTTVAVGPNRARRFWGMAALAAAGWAMLLEANGVSDPPLVLVLWWLAGIAAVSAIVGHRGEHDRPASAGSGGLALGLAMGCYGLAGIAGERLSAGGVEADGFLGAVLVTSGVVGCFFLLQLIALLRQQHAVTGHLLALTAGGAAAVAVPLVLLSADADARRFADTIDPWLAAIAVGVGVFALSAMLLDPLLRWLARDEETPADGSATATRHLDLAASLVGLANLGVFAILLLTGFKLLEHRDPLAELQWPHPLALGVLAVVACGVLVTRWQGRMLAFGGLVVLAVLLFGQDGRRAEVVASDSLTAAYGVDRAEPLTLLVQRDDAEAIAIRAAVGTIEVADDGRGQTQTLDLTGRADGWHFAGSLHTRIDERGRIQHQLRDWILTDPRGAVVASDTLTPLVADDTTAVPTRNEAIQVRVDLHPPPAGDGGRER